MTATPMTPGLGTRAPEPSGQAGTQTGRLAEGLRRSSTPAWLPCHHGPGSRAHCPQGQEGLGVLCLCLCGDGQAQGHRPPHHSPKPHTLAGTCASSSHRGEFLGQLVLLPGGRGGPSQFRGPGSGSRPPPLPPSELVEGAWWEASRCPQPPSGCERSGHREPRPRPAY